MLGKIIIIAPSSIHTSNFIGIIGGEFKEVIFISSEEELGNSIITRQYKIDFKSINPIKLIKGRGRLREILIQENPDVVHVHQVTRHAFLSMSVINKLEFPVVLTAWGTDVLVMPFKNLIFKFLVRKCLLNANYITADSEELISCIKQLANPRRTKKVLFGINPIKPGIKEKIIYSNRLHKPLYNINNVVKLFSDFVINHKEWKLVIGAVGSETESLKKLVSDLHISNSVEFIGWLEPEDNVEYYKKSSIYISIPDSDGTAVSLLEAMSAGCIPIVPNLDVSKEWIKDNENGIIYKQENPFYYALKLNQEKVSNLNQSIISKKGTKEVAKRQYLEIYNELLF